MNIETDGDRTTGTLHAGWDYITSEPGQHVVLHCRVCREPMAVERDIVGPTSWAEAMAVRCGQTKGHPHDSFHCTLSGEPWHRQALALRQEAAQTASRRLADLLNQEADEIVRARTATQDL